MGDDFDSSFVPAKPAGPYTVLPREPLCEWCSGLDLYALLSNKERFTWVSLPSSASIQLNKCPFCKLIAHAFASSHRTHRADWGRVTSEYPDFMVCQPFYHGPADPEWFDMMYNCVCLVGTVNPLSHDQHQGYMHQTIEPTFDFRRLSSWVSTCETFHCRSCKMSPLRFEETFPGLPVLRLVDVELECLVELREVPRYVALSYIWGEIPSLRLSTMIRPRLMQPGGIKAASKSIPRTINDAILLVKKLGERYLWVDTLCLIQNDQEDLSAGVNMMDQIYEASWLTIAAACGHNANAGLPGVQEWSRRKVKITAQVTDSAYFGVYEPLEALLGCSVYTSRAWT